MWKSWVFFQLLNGSLYNRFVNFSYICNMKLLQYLTLKLLLKDPIITAKVYKILFEDEFSYQEPKQVKLNKVIQAKPTTIKKPENDLQRTLRELKSKPNKSKKDKESIGILEAVIKNGHNSFS